MNLPQLRAASALLVLFLCACGDDSRPDDGGKEPRPTTTCELETQELKASLSAQADGPSTKLFAAVFGRASHALDCGDTFVVTSGADRIVLEREPVSGDVIHYVATLPSTPEARTFTFAFDRPAPKVSAPSSRAHVPADFAVRDLTPSVRLSASEPIEFRLDPPMPVDATELTPETVRLRVVIEGSCVEEQTYLWEPKPVFPRAEVREDDRVTLYTRFFERKGTEPGCDATLRISEVTEGEVDPAFAGGISGVFDSEGSRHAPAVTVRVDW